MGYVQEEQFCGVIDSYTAALFTRVLGWTVEECDVLVEKAKAEVRDRQNQLYIPFTVAYGKRPEK